MVSCARATRGLRRVTWPSLARGTRTIRMCSFDARNEDRLMLARLKMEWEGGIVARSERQSSHSLEKR